MTDLIHYSKEPISEIYNTEQNNSPDMKPQGFWFSVEDGNGWKEWCEGEEWGLERLSHRSLIELEANAPILYLSSCEDIDHFHLEYLSPGLRSYTYSQIDWHKVAEKYQGIIIAPYQWERHLDGAARWYYGWDCSSGCVWDKASISSINHLDCAN